MNFIYKNIENKIHFIINFIYIYKFVNYFFYYNIKILNI